jgi:hypothetical protein
MRTSVSPCRARLSHSALVLVPLAHVPVDLVRRVGPTQAMDTTPLKERGSTNVLNDASGVVVSGVVAWASV